jgi:hypothetical protein
VYHFELANLSLYQTSEECYENCVIKGAVHKTTVRVDFPALVCGQNDALALSEMHTSGGQI